MSEFTPLTGAHAPNDDGVAEAETTPPNPVDVYVEHAYLYHGSPVPDITEVTKAEETTVGNGVYYTDSSEGAAGYAEHRSHSGGHPTVYTSEVTKAHFADLRNDENVRRVLVGDEYHAGFRSVLTERLHGLTPGEPWYVEGALRRSIEKIDSEAYRYTREGLKAVAQTQGDLFSSYLSEAGYDGVIYRELGDGDGRPWLSYVVFDPTKAPVKHEQQIGPKIEPRSNSAA